jgi:archaeosine synthase
MKYFFEILANRIGFARIGRIIFSKERKLYINTPNILIPIKSSLMKQFNFVQEFEIHDLFTITKEFFLKVGFIREKFRNNGFIFTYPGTLQKFEEILTKNSKVLSKDNIISLIPFNIPTTSISKEFALKEIKHYLVSVQEILEKYPNFNFGISIKLFDYAEFLDLYIPIIDQFKNIKIINLADLFDNLNNFRNILRSIVKIKTELDNNLIIMASGRIIPKFYPLLIYLGIDLIDSSYMLFLSAENFYDTIEYLLPIYKMKYLPCSCLACKSNLNRILEDKYSAEKIDLLTLHNLISANNYMNKIKQYLKFEDYRVFVEKSSFDDTNLISMLKILDKEYYDVIKYESPIKQKGKIIRCIGQSSYYRPDFQQFREKTVNNFEPEPWTSLIILLPCSAKKPYSKSKSHKKFYSIIRKFPEFPSFQEIILTSPLGCIPRQLENIYPVNSYDISVTGDWDNEEIKITSEMLVKIIKKYEENIPIICHLKNEYHEIVKRASSKLPHKFIFSDIYDKITSKKSLKSLEKLIIEYKNKYKPKTDLSKFEIYSKTWTRKFIKILDYQFNPNIGKKILSNGLKTNQNRSANQIILKDPKTKKKIGVFKHSTGQIELTLLGFERLIHAQPSINANYIIFDGEEIQGNTLFRPGILDFSLDLFPGKQVVILDKTKRNIIGSGELIVGSNFLKNSKSGRVVKINE